MAPLKDGMKKRYICTYYIASMYVLRVGSERDGPDTTRIQRAIHPQVGLLPAGQTVHRIQGAAKVARIDQRWAGRAITNGPGMVRSGGRPVGASLVGVRACRRFTLQTAGTEGRVGCRLWMQ